MIKIPFPSVLSLLGLCLASTSAHAAILMVDFGTATSPVETGFVGQSATSFTHSTTAGDITVAISGQQGNFDYAPPNTTGSNTDMYRDFFYKNGGSMTLTLSGPGIGNSTEFTLEFWTQYQAQARPTTFAAAGGSTGTTLGPISTTNAAATGLADPNHYTSGNFTSNSSGVLTFTIAATDSRPAINGFTITAVPEPASAALLALGSLALFLRRRASFPL